MLFDSTILAGVTREVSETLVGARVTAVRQPHFAVIYAGFGGRGALCACCAPDAARVHLAGEVPEAPGKPLPFCSALRRHLLRARLTAARQLDFDRVLWLHFDEAEGLGPECRRALVVEVMGRHSNIILVDDSQAEGPPPILACAKHVTSRVNRYRQILPGEPYIAPPPTERLDPRSIAPERLSELVSASAGSVGPALAKSVAGASPVLVAEVLHRAGLSRDEPCRDLSPEDLGHLASALRDVASAAGAFVHVPLVAGEKPVPYPAALDHLARTHRAEPRPTLSAALEEVALGAQETAARAQLKSRLAAAVASALGRASTKLASRREQLESAEGYEDHRRIGEAILANLHRIAEGAERATLVDYSDPEQRTMEVELDPSLSPAANAQRHFNLYHKGKRIAARLPRLIAQVEKEAGYLADVEGRLAPIDRLDDLREIEGELGSRGYLGKARGSRRPARRASAPDEPDVPRVHAEGCMILYGRNEAQNEHLLRHLSAPGDVWLHVRGAPSGHVIVKCPGREEPPREVLLQAARLAARNSTLRRDDAVEVDYTLRKHVTKPKGSRPGFVRYTHAKTIIVKP